MNLITGTLIQQAGAQSFRAGGLTIPLPPLATAVPEVHAAQTILGIRPEDILLEPSARPQASLSGEIEVVEDLGADQILHMLVGAQRIIVRTPQGQTVKADSELTVHFPLDRLHLFVNDHRVDWAGPAHASE